MIDGVCVFWRQMNLLRLLDGQGAAWWGIPGVGYLERGENRPKLLELDGGRDILVEKLLREQPDAGTLYLLVQPRGGLSGAERVARMLAESPVFGRLREMHGEAFGERVAAKLVAVEGNIGEANLGLSPEDLARVQAEVSVVVNSAAVSYTHLRAHETRGNLGCRGGR